MQGEGPSTGSLCGFLRLGGCNLSCRWCDTPYTWDWTGIASPVRYQPAEELHSMPTEEVLAAVLELEVDLLVISGGEPLSQQRQLLPLLRALRERGIEIEFETNGTRTPLPELIELTRRFVVSPKLAHSGDPAGRRLVPRALRAFQDSGKADFKFVVASAADLPEVAGVVGEHGLTRIWIMPEGRTSGEVLTTLREIADATVLRRWNLTGRLHVLAWGDARAV